MTAPQPKPTITQLEANWQTHLAGMRAEQEARQRGVALEDGEALLDAAAGGIIINGFQFPPIHGAFMLMLGKVEELAAKKPILGTEHGNMAALAYILGCPEQAWAILRHPEGANLFEEAVTDFNIMFTVRHLKEITTWMGLEMERLKEAGDDVGKPPAA